MIKEFIGTGKTVEEARDLAIAGLNAPETADIKVEVLVYPQPKKFFGLIGGVDAQVKASYDDGKKEKKPQKSKADKKPNNKADNKKPNNDKKPPVKKEQPKAEKAVTKEASKKPEEVITENDINLDHACAYLKTMIDALKVEDAKISAKIVDNVVEMTVDCDDYGIIIGRRGETLDALQYLTGLSIKNETNKYVRVTVNVGDYRSKREVTLKNLAAKNAAYVLRTGRRFTFEPMNPYERRIIHTAVQEIEGVTSRSIGSGMDRKVIIEPEGGVKYQPKRNNGRGGNRRYDNKKPASTPDPNREKKVDRADIPKFGKIDVNKD